MVENIKYFIYKIVSDNSDKVYYGSTSRNINWRFSVHKAMYKQHIEKGGMKCSSFDVLEDGACRVELIEEIETDDNNIVKNREKHFIQNNECVNKNIPNRTRLEYYNDNCERLKQFQRDLYNRDKQKKIDKVLQNYYLKNADIIICECGGKYRCSTRNIHNISKKHKKFNEALNA